MVADDIMPQRYHGNDGQHRWVEDHYEPTDAELEYRRVVGSAMLKARGRLLAGHSLADVEKWLAEQVAMAMDDAAARWRGTSKVRAGGLLGDAAAARAAIARTMAVAWCRSPEIEEQG